MRGRVSSAPGRSQWWQSCKNSTISWFATTALLLLMLGLSTASAVLTCREALRLSDLNQDQLLNAHPEYTTFLQRISSSIGGSSSIGTGIDGSTNINNTLTTAQYEFDSLPNNLQVHFHSFSRNIKEGISITDSYQIIPSGQSVLDEFCQRTNEILKGNELAGVAPGDDGKGDTHYGSPPNDGIIGEDGVGNMAVPQTTLQGDRGISSDSSSNNWDSDNDILGFVILNGEEVDNKQHDASMGSLFEKLMSLFDNKPIHHYHHYLRTQRHLITIDECAEFLDFSDSDGNGSFSKAEFVLLVNLLTDHYRATAFSDLPESVQQIFQNLDNQDSTLSNTDHQRRLPRNVFQHGLIPTNKNEPDKTATDAVTSVDTICSQIRTAMEDRESTSPKNDVIDAMPMSSAESRPIDSLLQESNVSSPVLNNTSFDDAMNTTAMNTTQNVTFLPTMNTTQIDTFLPEWLGNQTNVTDAMNTTQNVTFLPAMNTTQDWLGNQTNVTLAPAETNQTLNNTQPETPAPNSTLTNTSVPPASDTTGAPSVPGPVTSSPSTTAPFFTQPPGTLVPVTTPPISSTTAPSMSPTNATAPPGPAETITALNSFVISNRLQQTAMDLMSDPASFAGIQRAYEAFVANIVAEMAASRAMRLRSRRRNLAVSIQPGSATVYELTDSQCPPTSADSDSCVTAFGRVNLRVSDEDTSSVVDQYVSISQFAIDSGALLQELNEQDPGSLWVVEGSSTPVDPTEASIPPPDDEAIEDRGGYDLIFGLGMSVAATVFLVLLICVFVILPAIRNKRKLEQAKKDALNALREAELMHAAAIARKEQLDKDDEKPAIGPPWPKTRHDEYENPYRERVSALLWEKVPDLVIELDSLLHHYRGREEELIAILKDIRSDESFLDADSDCEVDIEELSLSVAESLEKIPSDPPSMVDEVPVANVEVDQTDDDEWESDSSESVKGLEPPSGGSGSSLDPPGEDATDRAEDDDRLEPEESRNIPLEPKADPEPIPDLEPPKLEPEPGPDPPPREPTPEPFEFEEEKKSEPEEPVPPSPPLKKAEEPMKMKMDYSDHVTEESDWLSSSDGSHGYQIHWTQENGCWFGKKVPIKPDFSISSGYFSSSSEESDEEQEARTNFRWVKNGGSWMKEYFDVDNEDSDSEYASTGSDENNFRWVKNGGDWRKEYFDVDNEDSDSEYASTSSDEDNFRWVKNGGGWTKEYFIVDNEDSESEYASTSSDEDEAPKARRVTRNGQYVQEDLNYTYSSDEH